MTRVRSIALAVAVGALALVGCSSGGSDGEDADPAPTTANEAGTSSDATVPTSGADVSDTTLMAVDLRRAVEAVEQELGGPQQFFEVTATSQLTNVFVAIDEATGAVPYVFVDGELEVPGPALEGAEGYTFGSSALTFDDDLLLSAVADGAPERHHRLRQRRGRAERNRALRRFGTLARRRFARHRGRAERGDPERRTALSWYDAGSCPARQPPPLAPFPLG